jgi:group I intron endonuclease
MTETRSGIYLIKSANDRMYIGRSVSMRHRFYGHKNNSSNRTILGRSINKHKIESHKFSVITVCENNEMLLNDLEKHYIRLYNTFGSKHGMNMTSGGEGNSGYKLSQSAKDKIGAANKGTKASVGRVLSTETKKKISQSLMGNKLSDAQRYKAEQTRIDKGLCSIVFDQNTGVYYNSIREAATLCKENRAKLNYKVLNNIHPKLMLV